MRAHGERDLRNGRQTTTKEIEITTTTRVPMYLAPSTYSSAGDETAIIIWSTEPKKRVNRFNKLKKAK